MLWICIQLTSACIEYKTVTVNGDSVYSSEILVLWRFFPDMKGDCSVRLRIVKVLTRASIQARNDGLATSTFREREFRATRHFPAQTATSVPCRAIALPRRRETLQNQCPVQVY